MESINLTCLRLSEYDKQHKNVNFTTKVEYYSKYTKDVIDIRHCEGTIFFFPQNVMVQIEYDIGEAPLRYEDLQSYVKVGEDDTWKKIKISCSDCNSNGKGYPSDAVEAFFKITGINPYEDKTITF